MATLADLLADLNDRIDDAGNTQVPEATKIRYLRHGISAMWDRIYKTALDTSLEIVEGQYEYDIPAAVGDYAMITRIDVETGDATDRYVPLEEFDILPVQTSKVLVLHRIPVQAGARIRIVSAKRLAVLTTGTDTYDGPPGTEEIPVWYALGLVMDRRHENRLDYTRYTTVAAENGVDINEVMNSSQFAFAMFEALMNRYAMPLPNRSG